MLAFAHTLLDIYVKHIMEIFLMLLFFKYRFTGWADEVYTNFKSMMIVWWRW